MTPLETALVALVIIWTLIFVVVAIAMVVLLFGLKSALDKINNILSEGEDVAHGLGTISKLTASGVGGLLLKAFGDKIKRSPVKK